LFAVLVPVPATYLTICTVPEVVIVEGELAVGLVIEAARQFHEADAEEKDEHEQAPRITQSNADRHQLLTAPAREPQVQVDIKGQGAGEERRKRYNVHFFSFTTTHKMKMMPRVAAIA
jgi:hypothetical protein